ncbi:hypothetical protein BOX15_Mlig033032g3 [Macrostomum lignano]|uniref:Uncharacterized protein n=2 Tax=Macrostomum lignano TaxID=282301 RepID=A0A267F338_9PLAT|nr:hypothetical protein BOX15_Mlig033032g1 [Macrostomum lignano]PAA93437.1 hypothetical protein BOX15_Mlig033032g3 [Macrostomum lignano]
MLSRLPPLFWRIFPLVLYGSFIVSGIVLIASGAVRAKRVSNKDDLLGYAEVGSYAKGVTSIGLGLADLLLGIAGIATTLLGYRWMYFALMAALLLTLLSSIITYYGIRLNAVEDVKETRNTIREMMIKFYGNNSISDGREFTEMINTMQSDRSCCGLSGVEKENIFLVTPWHRLINVNNNAKHVITLPDSCCTSHVDECRFAKDIKAAREAGFVHNEDCLYSLFKAFDGYLLLMLIEVFLCSIMHLITLVYIAVYLKFGPESSSTASE